MIFFALASILCMLNGLLNANIVEILMHGSRILLPNQLGAGLQTLLPEGAPQAREQRHPCK